MICLCCGKEIKSNAYKGWHPSCVKRFFETSELPEIELSEKSLLDLANSSLDVGKTVTGVQKKLSLNLSVDNKTTLFRLR